jgi:hypothetical protein
MVCEQWQEDWRGTWRRNWSRGLLVLCGVASQEHGRSCVGMTKTIDDYCDERRDVLLACGDTDECWNMLGIANRHIDRVIEGKFVLTPGICDEIEACFDRTLRAHDKRWM